MTNKAVLFQVPPDSEYTGVMLALFPSPQMAEHIAAMDGVDTPADQLHVTLAYAGKVDMLTDLQVAGAIVAAQKVATYSEPLTGTINGVGRFNASQSSDGQDVIYAVIDLPGLDDLRSRLGECLEEHGIEPSGVHGYTPHMTLAYIAAGAESPVAAMPTMPIQFSAVSVAVGGKRVDYPMMSMEDPEGEEDYGHKSAGDLRSIKMLGANRVGGYMMLWGSEKAKDLDQEWFTPATEELTTVFKAVGKLPYLYNHATDGTLKTALVGTIDVMTLDDVGLWYEAQLDQSNKYLDAIRKLVKQRALGTSSGTLPGARQVAKSGQILRWPVVEGSMTPTPADPRQIAERPIAEIKSAYTAIGLDFPQLDSGKGAENARQSEITKGLALLALLELESTIV